MFRALAIFSMLAILVSPVVAQDVIHFSTQKFVPGMGMAMAFPATDEAMGNAQKALHLSEAQVSGLKALMNLRTESSKGAFRDLAEKQMALQTILDQQNPAAVDIGNAYLAVQSAQSALNSMDQKLQTDFRALLTADQKTTLQNLESASSQIEALRLLGVLAGGPAAFKLPMPSLQEIGPRGTERSIQVFRPQH